jgi:hypothetical protein
VNLKCLNVDFRFRNQKSKIVNTFMSWVCIIKGKDKKMAGFLRSCSRQLQDVLPVLPQHFVRTILMIGLALLMASSCLAGRIQVAKNHRYLEYEDGRPFFYLGDTAWELFHRLNREEAVRYLTNRAEKGFTVIQAVVLAEIEGLDVPNAYGDLPLIDKDPAKPSDAYFQHVDYIC